MRSTFGAFRHRQYGLLFIGLTTSSLGDFIAQFALGWLAVQLAVRDGAPQLAALYIGFIGLASAIPGLFFGPFGGVLADRVERRRLLIIARVVGAAEALALAALVFTDHVTIPGIMALVAIVALTGAVDVSARQAVVPRLVDPADLVSAQSLLNATSSMAAIAGPLIGGVLIGPIGVGGVVAVKTVFHLAAVASLVGLRPMPAATGGPRRNVLQSLQDGFLHVARDGVLRWVMAMSLVGGLFARPLNNLMPAVAANELHVGPTELSWLLAAAGAGGLAGSVISASLGAVPRRGLLLAGIVVSWGAVTSLFGLQRTLAGALLLVAMPSIGQFTFGGLALVLCQLRSPDHLRARTISVYLLTATVGASTGSLVLGAAATVIGIGDAIFLGGLCISTIGLFVLVRVAAFRELRMGDEAVAAGGAARG